MRVAISPLRCVRARGTVQPRAGHEPGTFVVALVNLSLCPFGQVKMTAEILFKFMSVLSSVHFQVHTRAQT